MYEFLILYYTYKQYSFLHLAHLLFDACRVSPEDSKMGRWGMDGGGGGGEGPHVAFQLVYYKKW